MKFTGDLATLKERFADLNGEWVEQTANHIQFRAPDGAVMSWYPSTGTIYVDGKPEPRERLQREVDERLTGVKTIHGEQPAQVSPPAAAPQSNLQATPPERRSDLGFEDSELVLGLVSATGTDLELVTKILEERLRSFRYRPQVIKISSDIIDELRPGSGDADFNARTNRLMDAGNALRHETGDHSVLALAASARIGDKPDGRDYKRGFDSNAKEKRAIMDEVVSLVPETEQDAVRRQLSRSRLDDITEYGRMVHAEMEALLACGRVGISTQGATLYCTTFPCHNCAKHIIAAGIERVVYVEPYPKSKALEFHSDAVSLEKPQDDNVVFAPFVGVGPRSFFNLFSMRLGSGYPLRRKTKNGDAVGWDERNARLRMQMLPTSYIDRETLAADLLLRLLEQPE